MKTIENISKARRRRCAAVTLVDTMVAVVILGIAAAGLLGAFSSGFFTMRLARENQRATQILLEKVEMLRLYSWDQVNTAGFIPSTFTTTFDPQAASTSQGIVYDGTLIINNSPFSANYSNDVRLVTVTLSWSTGSVPHTRILSTLVSKDGLQNYVF